MKRGQAVKATIMTRTGQPCCCQITARPAARSGAADGAPPAGSPSWPRLLGSRLSGCLLPGWLYLDGAEEYRDGAEEYGDRAEGGHRTWHRRDTTGGAAGMSGSPL